MNHYEIIILGAGAAGLMASSVLAAEGKKVLVLEARGRIGGRIHTLKDTDGSIHEAGAEFVHGNLPITLSILNEAHLQKIKTGGHMARVTDGKWNSGDTEWIDWEELWKPLASVRGDITLGEYLKRHFSAEKFRTLVDFVTRFAQGFDAADINKVSVRSLQQEWESEEDPQYRIRGGYGQLCDYLNNISVGNGAELRLSAVVKKVKWDQEKIKVTIQSGELFSADRIVCALPLGVLQSAGDDEGAISFEPQLPNRSSFHSIGNGHVVKTIFNLSPDFFERDKPWRDTGFIFTNGLFPTWWTQHPDPPQILTGWLAGPPALAAQSKDEITFLNEAATSLTGIVNANKEKVDQNTRAKYLYNWTADSFSRGAYSYATPETEQARKLLNEPLSGKIFFAGEAYYNGPYGGTVEAALKSGLDAAQKILTL